MSDLSLTPSQDEFLETLGDGIRSRVQMAKTMRVNVKTVDSAAFALRDMGVIVFKNIRRGPGVCGRPERGYQAVA